MIRWLVLGSVCAALPSVVMAQGTTHYVYDDNGRLHAVISPAGEATVWEYDAAGNFTAIRRLTATDLELLSFSPHEGVPGDLVTFIGVGFGAGVNAVSFNGTLSNNVQVTSPIVVAEVPVGATTGPITLTTPLGSVTTSIPFTIRGVRVNPMSPTVVSRSTVQFTATVVLTGDQSVTWSVNGITGGNTALGTISGTGLYTAPDLSFNQRSASFFIRATSVAAPTVFGEARVTVQSFQSEGFAVGLTFSVLNNVAPASTGPTSVEADGLTFSLLNQVSPVAVPPTSQESDSLTFSLLNQVSPPPSQPTATEADSLTFSLQNTSSVAPQQSSSLTKGHQSKTNGERSAKRTSPKNSYPALQHHKAKGKNHAQKRR